MVYNEYVTHISVAFLGKNLNDFIKILRKMAITDKTVERD
jgi:hypothetical protein